MVDHVMVPVDVSSTLEYVNVTVSSNTLNIPITVGNAIIVHGGEHYEGPYEVIPKAFNETVLETKDLLMDDDVTVLKIPYYETSNLSGGYTVFIAGEV